MASFLSRRLANSLSWNLNIQTRRGTWGLTYAPADQYQRRRREAATFTRPVSSTSKPSRFYDEYRRAFTTHTSGSWQAAGAAGAPSYSQKQSSYSSQRPSNSSSQTSSTQRPAASSTQSSPATSRPSYPTSRPTEPPPPTARSTAAASPSPPSNTTNNSTPEGPLRELSHGLSDAPPTPSGQTVDWTSSYHGLSNEAFSKEASDILLKPLNEDDIEIKPDGIVYLPEIKYRRILNRAFGPGAWGLAPRGETIVTQKSVTREYALLVHGRLVSVARGEQDYFDPEGIPTATEGCKSNALMRCCKDLGVASELWDPRFIRKFMKEQSRELWVEHQSTKKRRKIVVRKDDEVKYPYKVVSG